MPGVRRDAVRLGIEPAWRHQVSTTSREKLSAAAEAKAALTAKQWLQPWASVT
jgi:hypothetical protein